MKKLALLLFAFVAFSVNAVAQKTTVVFDFKKITIVDNNAVSFDIVVNNIKDEQEKEFILNKFKTRKEVISVSYSDLASGSVAFTVKSGKDNFWSNTQQMLISAGIEEAGSVGDKRVISTSNLVDEVKKAEEANQEKKQKRK